jgi:hypothetical protein
MVTSNVISDFESAEVTMGTVVSKVPRLLAERKWSAIDLVRRGLAISTAYRLARGETGILLDTAAQLVVIFGLRRLDDVFEIVKQEGE